MSIKAIDAQIMVSRTPDVARDTSEQLRNPQLAQEHLAARNMSESQTNLSRVQESLESEMENIRTDVDEDHSGSAGGGKKKDDEPEEEEEVPPELMVAPAAHNNIIDIMI